jgi:cytochrome c3-like protein
MSRQIPSGTPTRSSSYVFPVSNRRLFYGSLLAGLVVLVAIVGLYFVGAPRFTSPGDLATQHAPIDVRCEQCHSTRTVSFAQRGVIDVRCERCHDPGASARLTNAAHVLLGSGDSLKAERAGEVPCVQCHTDHRGRTFKLRTVDDRECGRCHGFSSLGRHPEFAVIKANIQTGVGLKFDHDRHVVEAVKKTGKPCEACHQPTSDLTSFEALSFDRHCAACHTKDGFVTGATDAIAPDLLTLPGQPGVTAVSTSVQVQPAARGRVTIGNMKHRDPWVLYNALKLRRAIDPEGESSERLALRGQVAFLEQQLRAEPLARVQRADLERWAEMLQQDIRDLDARIAAKPAPGDDSKALETMTATVKQIATALRAAKPTEAAVQEASALAGETVDASAPPSGAASTDDAARFEARKKELLSVLDAVSARGDKALSDRAAALRSQVEKLSPGSGEPDRAALRQGLLYLDEVFRAVRNLSDPEAQVEASRVAVLRQFAQQRVAGGLSPEDFEDRRRELLGVLDAIDRAGDPALRQRVAELRQRAAALRPGTIGDDGLKRLRGQKVKALERVNLEIELQSHSEGEASPAVAAPVRDRREMESTIARLKAQLAELEGGPRPGAAVSPDDLEKNKVALESLLVPCAKCHELRGARLAPVTIAQPVMPHSVFDHKPHVTAAKCESCHASIEKSKKATDINEPNLANCQQCHAPSKSRSDCGTCHVYHPPSVAKLLRTL